MNADGQFVAVIAGADFDEASLRAVDDQVGIRARPLVHIAPLFVCASR